MQEKDILLTQGRYILIAGMLLVIMAIAPAAQATSLAPAIDSGSDQGTQADAPANPALTREAVKFLEDNWYFDYADRASETEAEANNPVSAESSPDAFDIDAMERYPGLYTEPTDEASAPIVEEDSLEVEENNPALTRDRIRFLEDNWYFDPGALIQDDDLTDDESESRPLTREEFQFNEYNWHFDTGETFPQDEVNDSTSGASSGKNADRSSSGQPRPRE
jgi:hypothetical protein